MKYYIIAGEASGDLHASRLMTALKRHDSKAVFRFIGGDMMAAVGGSMVNHYRNLAYMGFVPVLLHLRTIISNMAHCKCDIAAWCPDVVILVDYPGFNLSIAKYVRSRLSIPTYYYISPKIWAWKEYRIKSIKRDVTELFSILPFEVEFFERKHHYPTHYVGNPTADEVDDFLKNYSGDFHHYDKPIIALLAGSRRQEIKDNLPPMIKAVEPFTDRYQIVVAGAPGIEPNYYNSFITGSNADIVLSQTYPLLANATAALVTSGTATLETALFNVPQVVCYKTPIPKVIAFLRRHLLKVKYISLVNLITDSEIVTELVADTFTIDNIRNELAAILPGGDKHDKMLCGYKELQYRLGKENAPDNAARIMIELLQQQKSTVIR